MPAPYETIKARPDFLRAARGGKAVRPTLVLQCADRRENEPGPARFGFTATRKLGGAVVRNRAKRRLRAAVRQTDAACVRSGRDYVLIGRGATSTAPFDAIVADLRSALKTCVDGRAARGPSARPPVNGRTQ